MGKTQNLIPHLAFLIPLFALLEDWPKPKPKNPCRIALTKAVV